MRHICKAFREASLLAGSIALAACSSNGDPRTEAGSAGASVVAPANAAPSNAVGDPPATAGAGSMRPSGGAMNSETGNMPVGGDPNGQMPCAISSAVKANCQTCHGTQLLGGAPMSLLSYEDFHRDHVVKTSKGLVGQTKKVYELAALRLTDRLNPMPPSGSLTIPEDTPALMEWLQAGAPPGGQGDSCVPAAEPATGATAETGAPEDEWDFNPPTPTLPGEQCFELQMHGGQTPDDTSPYMIEAREYYTQFYFKVPWPANYVSTKAGARYDAVEALHHWLLFTTNRGASADGTHEEVLGTQLGDDAQLLYGWAIGGATIKLPQDVGLELPPPDTMLNVQWHYFNSKGAPIPDRTTLIVCAVPRDSVKNVATTTWLGTEAINVPPRQTATATGSCINDSSEPIHIIGFLPHMHTIGVHMKSEVVRAAGGAAQTVFDKPFSNTSQMQYNADVTLMPNDKIISTCTFQNEHDTTVGFGPSTTQEMCYQFALSYPAHALENGVFSLIGAANTCWQFGE